MEVQNGRPQEIVLRTAEVARRVGLSPGTIRRLERLGRFPARRKLGVRAVGWEISEIEAWLADRPRGDYGPRGHAGDHQHALEESKP